MFTLPVMAMILEGMPCKCAICGRNIDVELLDNEDFVSTTHFIEDRLSSLWRFSDAAMHRECFQAWPLRAEFIAAYNDAMRNVIDRHGTHSHMNEDGEIVSLDEQGQLFQKNEAEEEKYLANLIASFPSQQPPKSLPQNVEFHLKRGKDLAAEVFCERDGWRAWVWVHPVMASGKTWQQVQQERSRTRLAIPYDDAIAEYYVRYVELSDWHLADERLLDLDLAIEERPIVDQNWVVNDEKALITLLNQRLYRLHQLRSPRAVDYPDPPATEK